MPEKKIKLLSSYKNVVPVTHSFIDFLKENGTPEKDCKEIELCLVESLNNVIRHSYKEEPENSLQVEVKKENNEITLKVSDYGIPRKDFKKPILQFDPNDIDSLPEGGMGLYFIDQLMDSTEYHTIYGVNIFTMKKTIK